MGSFVTAQWIYAMGGITGPLSGYYIATAVGFKKNCDIQAYMLLTLCALQLMLVYIPLKMKERKLVNSLEQVT